MSFLKDKNTQLVIMFVLGGVILASILLSVFWRFTDSNASLGKTPDSVESESSQGQIPPLEDLTRYDIDPGELQTGKLVAEEMGYSLYADFNEGENLWSFSLRGNLENSCVTAESTVIVQGSYPETIVVNVVEEGQGEDEVCLQVMVPYQKTGVVSASEKANFEIRVEK